MARLISGFLVMGVLFFLAATMPQAREQQDPVFVPAGGGRGPASALLPTDPCERGITLQVAINPVDVVAGSGAGLELKVEPKGKGVAMRTHVPQSHNIGRKDCLKWQDTAWPLLQRVLGAHRREARKGVTCANTGVVRFKTGNKSLEESICLSGSKQDRVSVDFRQFYDRTDSLVGRR